MKPARPYEGLTVIEAVSGPPGGALRLAAVMAGRIFADLGAKVIVFPELCVTGATCGDLFFQDTLLNAAEEGDRKSVV